MLGWLLRGALNDRLSGLGVEESRPGGVLLNMVIVAFYSWEERCELFLG